jgi:methylene-tetrahydromethanopterin dehydrogenase
VKLESIHGLAQDVIFSRSPSGIKRTGIFIGGRDIGVSLDMINSAKQAMFPPFEVSVLADPSGAFTTAAALVACVEKELKEKHNKDLADCTALVFGGTGPVGIATGVIASLAGAKTSLVDHMSIDTANDAAKEYSRRCQCELTGKKAGTDEEKEQLIANADIIFCTAKAGIQVLSTDVLSQAKQLLVAGDVNAVPPAGIAGIGANDNGVVLDTPLSATGIGALAVGNIKYQLQHKLLELTLESEKPVYLDFREAFSTAQQLV